jgi:NAD(P)-dependent dehydrogenase (short-subunit alcohol dehydrogenase family)
MPWDDLMREKSYSGWSAYGESKLANILFTRELAKRLGAGGVTANSLHPGFVATNFGNDNGGFLRLLLPIAKLFALSEEAGARTSIWAATSEEVAGVTGKYFAKCRESTPTREARSDEDAARLWKVSEELVSRAGVTVP